MPDVVSNCATSSASFQVSRSVDEQPDILTFSETCPASFQVSQTVKELLYELKRPSISFVFVEKTAVGAVKS